MSRARQNKRRAPEGFDALTPTLEAFTRKMREAEAESLESKRPDEVLWPIMRIHHQRSRYIYQLYYDKKEITKEVYDYCLAQKIADANLIAKWKKSGYEHLCCLKCSQATSNFGAGCICRVPKKDLSAGHDFECKNCGCRGCSS
jgi:bud site selection protein 31